MRLSLTTAPMPHATVHTESCGCLACALGKLQDRVAQVQRAGGVAGWIDCPHAIDLETFRAAGVRVEELLISQPDTTDQAYEILETLIRSGAVELVVMHTKFGFGTFTPHGMRPE